DSLAAAGGCRCCAACPVRGIGRGVVLGYLSESLLRGAIWPDRSGFRQGFIVLSFQAAAARGLARPVHADPVSGRHRDRGGVFGALDFRDSPPRISGPAAAHLSLLLAMLFLQRAMNYWLARPELLLHTNGVVYGLRYVDHVLWEPGLWLLVVLSLVAAAVCLANLGQRGLRLPV